MNPPESGSASEPNSVQSVIQNGLAAAAANNGFRPSSAGTWTLRVNVSLVPGGVRPPDEDGNDVTVPDQDRGTTARAAVPIVAGAPAAGGGKPSHPPCIASLSLAVEFFTGESTIAAVPQALPSPRTESNPVTPRPAAEGEVRRNRETPARKRAR